MSGGASERCVPETDVHRTLQNRRDCAKRPVLSDSQKVKGRFIRIFATPMEKFNIIVLAKQVPDTRQVGKDAMNADGTINRAALPAVFNPEDLNALEQALAIKDRFPGSTVTMLTMGPERAKEIVMEGVYRGADGGYLLTDRLFAGADTLATSYALSTAIRKIGKFDIIIGGRQAIDGDTAQVGPQVAEKLGLNQITYVEEILEMDSKSVTVKRVITGGVETVKAPLPCLLTVNGSAAPCRPRNARLLMGRKNYDVPAWTVADVNADPAKCGLSGSPTKVKKIENIVFQAKESKRFGAGDADIAALIEELAVNHIIG
jgi:Electron transfer flavoprotein, beta subunit